MQPTGLGQGDGHAQPVAHIPHIRGLSAPEAHQKQRLDEGDLVLLRVCMEQETGSRVQQGLGLGTISKAHGDDGRLVTVGGSYEKQALEQYWRDIHCGEPAGYVWSIQNWEARMKPGEVGLNNREAGR